MHGHAFNGRLRQSNEVVLHGCRSGFISRAGSEARRLTPTISSNDARKLRVHLGLFANCPQLLCQLVFQLNTHSDALFQFRLGKPRIR